MLLWVLTFSLTLQVTFLRSAMTREGKIKCRSCQEERGKYRIRNIKFSFLKTWLCLLLFCRCQLLESGGERWFEKNAGECKVRGTCQERHHLRRRRNGYPDTHHGPHLQGESSNYVNYRLSRPTLTLPTTHKSPRERFRNQTSFKVYKKHCYSKHQFYHYQINMVKYNVRPVRKINLVLNPRRLELEDILGKTQPMWSARQSCLLPSGWSNIIWSWV